VYVRAKELHFVTDEPRTVFLIRQTENPDVAAGELISRQFPDRQHDFVLNINENDIVVVKSLQPDTEKEEIHAIAEKIEKTLYEQLGIRCVIGISTEARHLRELADCLSEGYRAYVLFVIAMKGARVFRPNEATHPAFGQALRQARDAGVKLLAMDCNVTPDSIALDAPVAIEL
jgi:sugar diacid utilization regulator